MVNALTSAQVRAPMRTRTADRVSAERTPAERGPGDGRPSPIGQPRRRMAPSAMALLESARSGLADAVDETTSPAGRYVAAHLAALRAAAAVVAVRGEPSSGSRRRRPRSVWELLPQVEPALAEWAAFFAAGANKRAAAEAGLSRAATAREADDLLRDAEIFLSVVETALGVPGQSQLPLRTAG
jgi:SAV_6107-like HEPN